MSHSLPSWVALQTNAQYHTMHILSNKTYWRWVTHLGISKLVTIGWFYDLSPIWYLHLCWLIFDWTLWEIFGLIQIKITTIFFKKMCLYVSCCLQNAVHVVFTTMCQRGNLCDHIYQSQPALTLILASISTGHTMSVSTHFHNIMVYVYLYCGIS